MRNMTFWQLRKNEAVVRTGISSFLTVTVSFHREGILLVQ